MKSIFLTARVPVYAKSGFKVREQKPLGFAAGLQEAREIVRQHVPAIYGGANGHLLVNSVVGAELLSDDEGRYYVPVRQLRVSP